MGYTLLLAVAFTGLAAAVPVVTVDDMSPLTFGVGVSQISLFPGGSFLLLNHTLSEGSTSGVLTHWWITGTPISSGWPPTTNVSIADYTTFSFYIDGEATPSVSVQISQAALIGGASYSAPWGNDIAGKNSLYGGWHVNIPVPFQKSIMVELSLPTWLPALSHTVYAQARGVENLPPTVGAFTLPVTARLLAPVANSSLQVLDFHTLIDLPKGTRGLMLAAMIDMWLYGPNADQTNSLEGCWHFFTPPETPFPGLLLGTGGEDYPESAYYFNAGPYRGPTSGLSVWEVLNAELVHISFYKLHHRDPIFFRDGATFKWRNGDTNNAQGLKCVAQTGTPLFSPTPANVSTLVWAYTW